MNTNISTHLYDGMIEPRPSVKFLQ